MPAFRIAHAPLENFQSDNKQNCIIMDEVNFKYLKHVIVKFLTSREVSSEFLTIAILSYIFIYHIYFSCQGRSTTSGTCRFHASSTFARRRKATPRYTELEDELVRRKTQLSSWINLKKNPHSTCAIIEYITTYVYRRHLRTFLYIVLYILICR